MSSESTKNISVVVAIDFGTTFSGFAFAKKVKPEEINVNDIRLNNIWLGRKGLPKTNTALLYYVDGCLNLHSKWGEQALYYEQSRKAKEKIHHIIERFKLLLDKDANDNSPTLPKNLDARKVIADFFAKMKVVIEEVLERRCKGVPLSEVLFVLTVPAEWQPQTRDILRDCMYESKLLEESDGYRLEFMTEPEAAAIYCLLFVEEPLLVNDTYLVVDCGGGTVDLTVRTVLPDKTLDEETVRSGGLCGSTFVDQEFLKFLGRVVGLKALEEFKEKDYESLQKLIYKFFCPEVKLPFDGDSNEFESAELDLQKWCPALIKYITGDAKKRLESEQWIIDLEFEDVMRMFDPAVNKIIDLINEQLENLEQRKVKTMFLVGGFSESAYLFKRVKSTFKKRIPNITIPPEPIAAIAKGACYYGLNKNIIKTRRLKWSYGIEVKNRDDDKFIKFDALAYKGEKLNVNEERSKLYETVKNNQLSVKFNLIYSDLPDPKYISQDDVKSLGTLIINLPLKGFGTVRQLEFFLKFAEEELRVTARNKNTQEIYHTTFNYPSYDLKKSI